MDFEKHFKKQYMISMVNIETAMLKLRGGNGNSQIQGQEGGYPSQSGQPAGDNGDEQRSAEVVNGAGNQPPANQPLQPDTQTA